MRSQLAQDLMQDSIRSIIEYVDTEGDYTSKDIFLERDGEICGLHEVGFWDGPQWCRMEAWANAYTLQFKFIASVARIFGPIEENAVEMKSEGWKQIRPPANWGEQYDRKID